MINSDPKVKKGDKDNLFNQNPKQNIEIEEIKEDDSLTKELYFPTNQES